MGKLNQVLAVFKGFKARSHEELTKAYQAAKKPALFVGHVKVYEPKDVDGEHFPNDTQQVNQKAMQLLENVEKELVPFWDIALTRDEANCNAAGSIVVDGQTLAASVPATHILFLEKQLAELRVFLLELPELDPTEKWTWDPQAGLFKSDVVKTAKSKKVQKPIVLYQATDKHPAQTQMITEDETVGLWSTIKMSGALPAGEKKALVKRVETLLAAVQKAREAANSIDAEEQRIGQALFDYVLGRKA